MKERVKDKKKAVGIIGLATAAVCCVGVASVTNITNKGLHENGIVRVYADENTFIDQWNSAITELKRIDGDISTRDNYVDYLFAYIDASDAYAMISTGVTPEDELVYQAAGDIIREDAECYRYFANSLSKLYSGKNICWSHKEAYDANVNYFNSLDSMKQEVIVETFANGKFEEMCAYADGEFERIQSAMDDVIDAIDSIYYVNGEIVVDSKDSLDAVAQAIKGIYNLEYNQIAEEEVVAIAKYVTNLGTYDQAVVDYQAIVDACADMDARIVDTYNAFTTISGEYYNKHYTQRSIIETLRADYDALNRGAEDDATALVVESAKLVELEETLAEIDTDKLNVETLIAEIPTEFDYTDAYIATVNDAKEAFDLLPEDLKAIADEKVADYEKLTKALVDIEDCKEEVDSLIERAKNLQVLYDEGSEKFSGEVNGVARERAKLSYQKQKADFDEECGDLLFEMQTKLDNLSAKIKPFIDAVKEIGEVKLSNTSIGNQIDVAYAEYAKLTTELEQNAVKGYKTNLDEKKAELDALMVEANEWKATVESIVLGEKITTQNITDINAVQAVIEQIRTDNLDMYTVISTSGSTYGYAAYEALINAREGLFEAIEQLALDMTDLSTDLSVIVKDTNSFNQAILDATADFDALDDTVKAEYFTADEAENKAAYDNYLSALNIYNEVAKLAGDIADLYDIDAVDMTKYDAIMGYNSEYQALSAEDKEILDTQKINEDKTFKEVLDSATEKVEALKLARETWSNDVYALVGEIEKANWETDLYKVNLDTIEELKTQRLDLDNTDRALDQVDADFALIEEIANLRITTLNDLIDELEAKAELEKTDVATLESIYNIYNNKLDQTQKELVDYATFEILYNRYVFAQNFDEVIVALYEDVVTNGNYTSEVSITIGILRSIYINFGSEMKALIQEYATLDTIEAEYNAHVEDDGEVLNLTGVYNSLLAKIEADGSDLATEIEELSTQIVEIQKDYSDLVQDLADAKAALEKADTDNKQELINLINALESKVNTLKSDLEKADSDIIADIAKVREEVADVKADLEKLVADTKAELLAEIDALEKSLADAKAALEKADTDNKQELVDLINALETKVNTLKSDLEKADSDIIADIAKVREELADVKADLEDLVADTKAELLAEIDALEKSLADAKAALEKADTDNKQELINLINALESKVNTLKSDLEKADSDIIADIAKVREEVADVKADLEDLVADTKAELLAEIDALEKSLADAKAALEKADTDNKQELINLINALESKVNTLKSDLEKADSDIIADIAKVREELADVKADLEDLVADTKAELLAEIDGLRTSLTTITIILSIVSGLAAVGVIILLILKKKN